MQYSSFIGDHIPCRYKSLIEDSSLKQLVFASDDRPRVKPEFIAEFRNRVITKDKSKTSLDGEIEQSSLKKGNPEKEIEPLRSISLQDVFSHITRGGKYTRSFRGWKVCAMVHDKPILYGLPDDPKARLRRSNSLYLSSYDNYQPFITKSAKLTNLISPGSSTTVKSTALAFNSSLGQRSAMKVRSCHVAGANSVPSRMQVSVKQPTRPASSGPVPDRTGVTATLTSASDHRSRVDEINDAKSMHEQNVDSYAANYRDGYTYRKLQEQRPRSSSSPTTTTITMDTTCPSPPAARQQILKPSFGRSEAFPTSHTHRPTGTHNSSRSTPTNAKSTPAGSSGCKSREKGHHHGGQKDVISKDQDPEQKIPPRWPTSQRFRDLCDPQLTINNPSPTEVAVLYHVTPGLQTLSSPSIPSNTNGKFGGKSKDRPYPFQLHISAASCPVQSTVKKAAKFNI